MLLVLSAAAVAVAGGSVAAAPTGTVATVGTVTGSPSNSTLGDSTTGPDRATTDGDMLTWASMATTTGPSPALVTVTDRLAASPIPHTYQAGSLQVPPGSTPLWSTDGGTSWLTNEPGTPSSVDAVRASGLSPGGSGVGTSFPVVPIAPYPNVTNGDGWDVVFYKANVYATPHHGVGTIQCFDKASGSSCGSFALGSRFWTSGDAGAAIDRNAGLLWEAGFSPASTDQSAMKGKAQLQCFDLNANQPCATNAIDFGPAITVFAQNAVSETTLVNGKIYFLYLAQQAPPADPNRRSVLACWDPATSARCAGTDADGFFTLNLGSWQAVPNTSGNNASVVHTAVWAQNGRLFLQNQAMRVTCWDPGSDQPCPESSWPDGREIKAFAVQSGKQCGRDQLFTVTPRSYYCSGSRVVTGYGRLALTGLQANDFGSATFSVTDAAGAPIAGFTNLALSATTNVSVSGIPYGGAVVIGGTTHDTTTLHVVLSFGSTDGSSASWASSPPPALQVTWTGPPTDALCFKTVVPSRPCAAAGGAVRVATSAELKDITGQATLGPTTAAFDYQRARSCSTTPPDRPRPLPKTGGDAVVLVAIACLSLSFGSATLTASRVRLR